MWFGIPQDRLAQICAVFKKHPSIKEVILYGSRAKGTFKNGSDIDLAFKGDQLDLNIINQIDNQIDDLLLPWSFDLSIYSRIENKDLIDHIDRIGIAIYRRNEPLPHNGKTTSAGPNSKL